MIDNVIFLLLIILIIFITDYIDYFYTDYIEYFHTDYDDFISIINSANLMANLI